MSFPQQIPELIGRAILEIERTLSASNSGETMVTMETPAT